MRYAEIVSSAGSFSIVSTLMTKSSHDPLGGFHSAIGIGVDVDEVASSTFVFFWRPLPLVVVVSGVADCAGGPSESLRFFALVLPDAGVPLLFASGIFGFPPILA